MQRLEKTFEIGVPVRAAYNQWTQFEDFPHFMDGVKEVRQLDDTHTHWRASVAGKEKEWDAEITEQVPDRLIEWRSTSGTPNGGRVEFEPLGADRTRIQLALDYEPESTLEKVGDKMGLLSRRIDKTVEDFKEFIEKRGRETGGWRGEVHGGRETGTGAGSAGGLSGSSAAGSPAGRGVAPGGAGGAMPGSTGGTPGAGGGKPGSTSGGTPGRP